MQFFILFTILILFVLYFVISNKNESWYPTTTYVNTPYDQSVYTSWPYHLQRYSSLYGGPASQVGIGPNVAYADSLLYNNRFGGPVPINTIRRGMFGSMLTSLKPTKGNIGEWVRAGLAYTDNPNDFTNVDVFQLNLDPARDLYRYTVRTKDNQYIPIDIRKHYGNPDKLEDGDRFRIQGMEGKGDFIFTEADKYVYAYV